METINSLATKVFVLVIGSLFTTVTWFIKMEISEVSQTLKSIKTDVSELNRESLLLKQRVDFQMEWVGKEVSDTKERIMKIETRLERK